MTIKTKLTLNVIIVILIVAGVSVSSIIGMGFVKRHLQDLTQRSTPFQIRTVEFQRAIQGATADLIKVAAARSSKDYHSFRQEAEKSLAEVQEGEKALLSLSSDSQVEAHQQLGSIAAELFTVSEGRLKADEDALTANRTISDRLRVATERLKELDAKIKGLQSSTSTSYSKSVGATKDVSGRVRDVELLKLTLKDFQLGFLEVLKAQSKKGVLISQGKCNAAVNKALQNEMLKSSPAIAADLKALNGRVQAFIKEQNAVVGQPAADTTARDALAGEVTEKLNSMVMTIEQEGTLATDRLSMETGKQNSYFDNTSLATTVMAGNSELLVLGVTVEGLTSRLFAVSSEKEVDLIESDLNRVFSRIDAVKGGLAKALPRLNARREAALLTGATAALNDIRGLLFVKDGVVAKIRHRLTMEAKATSAMGKLREIVLQQSEKGKQTVSVAQVDQEKAIGKVNKVVRFSTLVIGSIGVGAVIFGILFGFWVYRSISRPLGELQQVSRAVAGGDLTVDIDSSNKDEVGNVQSAMAEMVHNLRGMVGKIKGATDSLAHSSEDLSATAISLEKGSEEQTSRIDQSAAAMTEMTQTTVEVAHNSTDTSDAAMKMRNIAEQGKAAMQQTALELDRFADSVKEAAAKVESLGQQSEEISTVVTLIHDVADQTNLLALNAAIEAARAGEQGRGFAVVADNVRQLAEKTSHATSEISQTVKTMQASVKSSVSFMQDERHAVARVQVQVQQTLGAIEEIVNYVEQVADMVQRIAVAAEEQSSTSEDVSRNMEGIAVIARDLRNSFGDIKSSASGLTHLATDLNSMVGWFKV